MMTIGMTTLVPKTDTQKAEMEKLVLALVQAANQSFRTSAAFDAPCCEVEGRSLGLMLECLARQIQGTLDRVLYESDGTVWKGTL
jgi:hypothetical protein